MNAAAGRVSILGVGHGLGSVVRGNDDSVFAYLHAHPRPNSDLFAGLVNRRVLGPGETLTTLMVAAAGNALAAAKLQPGDVGMLLGSGSVSDSLAPNALAAVHHALGLPAGCRALAINTEYTNFLDAMRVANDVIAAGTVGTALVVSGINWTQHMDYHEAVCVAASDAAGAAVVGWSTDAAKFSLVDWDSETDASLYGAFVMAPRPAEVPPPPPPTGAFTAALMKIDDATGRNAVLTFGIPAPPRVVARLLARNGLTAGQATVVAHQTSQFVAEKWKAAMAPALYVSTLEDLADMVSASVPVNLSIYFDKIPTDHLVLVGIGMEMNATALLYSRTPATG